MSARHTVKAVVDSLNLQESPDWALFEICNDHGIERPIRDWEIVTDVLAAWGTSHALRAIAIKKFFYRSTISPLVLLAKLVDQRAFSSNTRFHLSRNDARQVAEALFHS